jgi:hypothetical protein
VVDLKGVEELLELPRSDGARGGDVRRFPTLPDSERAIVNVMVRGWFPPDLPFEELMIGNVYWSARCCILTGRR